MTVLDFILNDIKRTKVETYSFLIGLSIPLTFIFTITLFINKLNEIIFNAMYAKMPLGLSFMNQIFHMVIWTLSILLVVLVSITLTITNTVIRQKDIAVMKGIGMSADLIYSFFVYRYLILLLASTLISVLSSFSIYLLVEKVYPPFDNVLWLGVTVTGIFLLSYFLAYEKIIDFVNKYTTIEGKTIMKPPSKYRKIIRRHFNWVRTFSIRSVLQLKEPSKMVIISLFIIYLMISFSTFSSAIVLDTSKNFIHRAYNDDVVVIGYSNVLTTYSKLILSENVTESEIKEILNMSIPNETYTILANLSFVDIIERRLLSYTQVTELPAVVYDPVEGYKLVGERKSIYTYVIGYEPDKCVSNWYFIGDITNSTEEVIVGDGLDEILFEDPLLEKIMINRTQVFRISAIVFDTLNKGQVVYVPLEILQEIYNISSYNLLLLKIKEINDSILEELNKLLSPLGLSYILFKDITVELFDFLDTTWLLNDIEVDIILISGVASVVSFVLMILSVFYKDLEIMEKIGGRKNKIKRITLNIGILITMISSAPAIFVGFFFALNFMIPDPIITLRSLIIVLLKISAICIITIISFVFGHALFSKYYRYKM